MQDLSLYTDIEAERAVLGAILLDAEKALGYMAGKKAPVGMFYDQKHIIIYSTIVAMGRDGRPIDSMTLTRRLEDKKNLEKAGGLQYITDLLSAVPTVFHLEYYLGVVMEKHKLRSLTECVGIVPEMIDKGDESSAIVAKVMSDIMKNVDAGEESSPEMLHAQSIHEYEQANLGHSVGLPSYLEPVNEILSSYVNANMYVVAGRPSNGKSTLIHNEVIHKAVGMNIPCAILSMEMSEKLLREMMAGNIANVSAYAMRNGMYSQDQFEKIKQAFDTLGKAPIFINESRLTIEESMAWLTYIVHKHHIRFAAIDYLQLFRPSHGTRNSSKNDRVEEWCAQVKDTIKKLNIPLLLVSQLSRAGVRVQDKTPLPPTLEALRDSGSIEQDADAVIFIYKKPDVSFADFISDKDWEMEIEIAKHRIGPIGTKPVIFVRRRQKFMEINDYDEMIQQEGR